MTATGVVFNIVNITWSPSYTETTSTALPALIAGDIAHSVRGTKTSTPIPPMGGGVPIFIPMGSEAPTVKLSGLLKGESNFTAWQVIKQGDLLYVNASEYSELAASGNRYWWVDQITISRTKGQINFRSFEVTVVKSLRKGDQTVRV